MEMRILLFQTCLINRNYRRFVEELVPVLKERDILYVVNESANLDGLPFEGQERLSESAATV